MFRRKVTDKLLVRNAAPADARAMGALQRRVFPTLSAADLLTEKHFRRHIDTFPAGQFVVTYESQVIASTSTFRCRYPGRHHTFREITGDLSIDTHDPAGEWLYGFDMGVDPALQGLGLGRYLYSARQEVVNSLRMLGQVIVGMPSGYGALSAALSFEEYYARLLAGSLFDPTVSVQLKIGFEPEAVVADYLEDPKCGNYGVMMKLPAGKAVALPTLAPHELEARIEQRLANEDAALDVVLEQSRSVEELPSPTDPTDLNPQTWANPSR